MAITKVNSLSVKRERAKSNSSKLHLSLTHTHTMHLGSWADVSIPRDPPPSFTSPPKKHVILISIWTNGRLQAAAGQQVNFSVCDFGGYFNCHRNALLVVHMHQPFLLLTAACHSVRQSKGMKWTWRIEATAAVSVQQEYSA